MARATVPGSGGMERMEQSTQHNPKQKREPTQGAGKAAPGTGIRMEGLGRHKGDRKNHEVRDEMREVHELQGGLVYKIFSTKINRETTDVKGN